jgi:glycosyltransferase involved in cell wall biosynthesis
LSSEDRPVTVSIGLPVRNGEDYLCEAVDSILNQTSEDFELVIVDNASTDATPEICEQYVQKEDRVRYVRNTRNLGLAANFNMAFWRTRGPYFSWAAHDDVYAPNFLARCVDTLENNPSAVVAHTDIQAIGEDGDALPYDAEQRAFVVDRKQEDLRYFDIARWREALTSSNPVTRIKTLLKNTRRAAGYTVYGVIRRSALRKTGLYRPFGGENLLMAELSLQGPFCYVPEPLFYFRLHGRNTGLGSRRDLMRAHLGHPPSSLFPLKTLLNYVNMVRASDLRSFQKLRCLGVIVGHALRLESLRRLFVPGPLNYFGINPSEAGDAGHTEREAQAQESPDRIAEPSR